MLSLATRYLCHRQTAKICSIRTANIMNRPRNRQPRPGRENDNNKRQTQRNQPRTPYVNVPNSQQVIAGASVSIVLKQDQPTGREVQGIVQDLLSRGDHPRGIKVRLQDGRIGRVQRMVNGALTSSSGAATLLETANQTSRQSKPHGRRRADEEGSSQEPPPRTLSDYMPNLAEVNATTPSDVYPAFSTATIKCPICGNFEGDEAAVSHHVEEHLD